ERLVRRALRWLGCDPLAWRRLAEVLWADPGRLPQAQAAWRVAANLGPYDEGLAWNCYQALADHGDAATGIAFLRQRHARLAARSAAPASTLARALDREHCRDEAVAVLRAAVSAHDDVDLRLHWFRLLLADRRHDEAAAVLEAADS